MWQLDHKESWAPKNWCFWILLEKTLESPLDCKEIQPVNPKGNQSWIFTGRTDAEALILWPPDAKNWLTGKDPGAGKDWRQEEKEMAEDEMVEWHHQHHWCESEQAPGVGDGEGSQACWSPWGCKESDTTERLSRLTESHLRKVSQFLINLNYILTIWSSSPTTMYLPKRNENSHSHRSLTPMFITSLLKIAENLKHLKVL